MRENETLSSLKRLFHKDTSEPPHDREKNWADDAEWVRRLKDGDRSAFSKLVEKYQKDIYLICYSILWHKEDAEEAAMVAFEKSFEKIWSLKNDEKYFAFLKQICANNCKDMIRQRTRERKLIDVNIPLEDGTKYNPDLMTVSTLKRPDEALEEKQEEETIKKRGVAIEVALNSLRDAEREIVVLKVYKNLTFEELGVRLGITSNTAKTTFYRALGKLETLDYLRELI